MTATAAPARSDRSDFRTVTTSGAALGVVTAVAVVLFLAASRQLLDGVLRSGAEALIVLVAGISASFLPAEWSRARQVEGIAGAAAIGLVGTIMFSAIDIVLFRPLNAFPWTWDAIGGGSTWWYLPVWWMLGTFLAWMGAIVTARQAGRGETTLARRAAVPVVATLVVVVAARLAGVGVALPVLMGAGYTVVLAVAAVVALARKG
ncbi:MAG TPA: hypothetical protein VH158_09130 [Gemmatimonadales bacterium]|nr:hypothetical protein [Gemmatimonadales bacterium]